MNGSVSITLSGEGLSVQKAAEVVTKVFQFAKRHGLTVGELSNTSGIAHVAQGQEKHPVLPGQTAIS